MKLDFRVVLVAVLFLASGCVTMSKSQVNKIDKSKFKKYAADLNGDGIKELVESEDKTAAEAITVVTVKKNAKGEEIDHIIVPGKIRKIEFIELNLDDQERMVILFEGKDNLSGVVIYHLQNNQLSKIFYASSDYGIQTDFGVIPRIRIGKLSGRNNSPNLIPDWETWVWASDKFVRE
jgi:hypothetical protein